MSDTLITVIAIALAAVLMFVFPLMTMSDRANDVSQTSLNTTVTNFVQDIKNTGVITKSKYDNFIASLPAGNSYDVELEVWILDETPGKKASQTNPKTIGENVYYCEYTKQITDKLKSGNYVLKEGDIIKVSAKNTNQTMSDQLSPVTTADITTLSAESSGTVTVNGK